MFIAMSIIMSEVNSECSRLWEYKQKAVKSPSLTAAFLASPACAERKPAPVVLKRRRDWLAISACYLAINTQSQ